MVWAAGALIDVETRAAAAAAVGGGCGMISVQPMAFIYELLYRIGFVPWDSDSVPDELQTLVEGRAALSPGRALDLGCGTGTNAVYLATRGWQVTAIDNVERALRRARDRAAARGVAVNWLNGDVSRLADVSLAPGFALVFDRGCYHGLGGRQRDAYAACGHRSREPRCNLSHVGDGAKPQAI